ncbi:MAG: hypothetical protein K2X74_00670 [Acetobacteraceae bacterium]|nr:hypothetical protein [Acetobacteraceae bacterium]
MARYPFTPGVSDHAHDRAALRLGRNLTQTEWLGLVLSILDRRAVLLSVQPDGLEQWLGCVGEVPLRVVWAPGTATIVTLLEVDRGPNRTVEHVVRAPLPASIESVGFYKRGERVPGRTRWREGVR